MRVMYWDEHMRVTYNPTVPVFVAINEVKYYIALSTLKEMLADGVITLENSIAIAEKYRISRYNV